MKIILAGGTGQIGRILARAWLADGHEVVILGRSVSEPAARRPGDTYRPSRIVRWVRWPGRWSGAGSDPAVSSAADPATAWIREIDGADAVVNLAGRSVDCRYTAANRRAILDSRVESTRAIGRAIASASKPPRVWLQSSTATIYAHRLDAPNDETAGWIDGLNKPSEAPPAPASWRFSVEVAKAWEAALGADDLPETRRVAMRTAMVMSPDRGGVFDVLLRLVRLGLGGTAGDGRQFVSWIHDADFVAAMRRLLVDEQLEGVINIAAPEPLPNRDFQRQLRAAWGQPIGLPAMPWMLELGARALGTETELVRKSRRVVPGRLLERGFDFQYPQWSAAAQDLCRRIRQR